MSEGKRLNPFQHALLRPENYIGTVTTNDAMCWVCTSSRDSPPASGNAVDVNHKFEYKLMKHNPGLEQIIVEIKSNIEDNRWASEERHVPMKHINVLLDDNPDSPTFGKFTFENDGAWISCEKKRFEYSDHRTGQVIVEEMYPAQLYFGEMLAGTNFDKLEDKKKTSGRNGIGAKATNIFSTYFKVTAYDPDLHREFSQTYRANSTIREEVVITDNVVKDVPKGSKKTGLTRVEFIPDYNRFGYDIHENIVDFVSVIRKRMYDTSMITGIPVTFNGERIYVKNLEMYAKMFFPDSKSVAFKSEFNDECVLIENTIGVQQVEAKKVVNVSFVNGVHTRDGGTHVDAWVNKIFPFMTEAYNSRKPAKGQTVVLKTTAAQLMPYFVLFVRCEVEGGTEGFEGQSKNQLVKPVVVLHDAKKGDTFNKTMKDVIADKVLKWDFVAMLDEKLAYEADAKSQRKEKRDASFIALGKKGEDANEAGKRDAMKCVLYITEGKSARGFAQNLILNRPDKKGNDLFGTFELKGKFINVQNASSTDVNKNTEVVMLKKMLGLMFGVDYSVRENREKLRYGSVCIVTDADDDGIHIRGLMLNFFYKFWPGLFQPMEVIEGTRPTGEMKYFVTSLSTAVTIVEKGKNDVTMFYSNPEFKAYAASHDLSKHEVRYIKGLGSHEPRDYKLYTTNEKIVMYTSSPGADETKDIHLGFDKGSSDRRKNWIMSDIQNEQGKTYITNGCMTLSQFVHIDLITYHVMILRRALPNIMDGLKESQLKILFGVIEYLKKSNRSVGVAVLAGAVKTLTKYHHGETSLEDGIKRMAMGFVGTNNIPILQNLGNFGSRAQGGEDAAGSRYISTRLENIARSIFNELDNPVLSRSNVEGKDVEYNYFIPVIPMILINGADGIASGFSSTIPCYNPDDIVRFVEHWIRTNSLPAGERLVPWYRGFKGTNELLFDNGPDAPPTGWVSKGILRQIGEKKVSKKRTASGDSKTWWEISETPIGIWPADLKEWIEYLSVGNVPENKSWKKNDVRYIIDYRKDSETSNDVNYKFMPSPEFEPDINVPRNFKILVQRHTLCNIVVLDENYFPKKYTSVESLLEDWCVARLKWYTKRKEYWVMKNKRVLKRKTNVYLFLKAVVDGRVDPRGSHQTIINFIENDLKLTNDNIVDDEDDEPQVNNTEEKNQWSYLTDMKLSNLTEEKFKHIEKELNDLRSKIEMYSSTSEKQMWLNDIANFKSEYISFLKNRNDAC